METVSSVNAVTEHETITLNQATYNVKKDEFILQSHPEYNNLKIYPKVGELERLVGLLNDLVEDKVEPTLTVYGWNYGGFVPINCSKVFKEVHVLTENRPEGNYDTIVFNVLGKTDCVFIADDTTIPQNTTNSYVLCNQTIELGLVEHTKFPLSNSDFALYVPKDLIPEFNNAFWYYFDTNGNFVYDNLIHLCIMVKNAGPLFETVLTENLPFIDRWTVLDTGSTDGTQDIVRSVLANKKGHMYEEPFINFRESRNRCLDLAGKHCKYLLMLDDTYGMRGDIRKFLTTVRGDQFASSYSLLILSDDVEYCSNRVTFAERGMRYIYTIHEVIQHENNKQNVIIPKTTAYIHDHRAPYMEKRTMDRKRYDLDRLYDMYREDPTNPRHMYYLAQTYNLLEDYENAALWFKNRATSELEGHKQEAVDSWFELGRIYNFKLNKPWDECKLCYEEAYKMDPSRPDALYFIGIHHYLKGDRAVAFDYFRRAFILGYPIHAQFSLKPTLSFHFLPKFLAELSYDFNDWKLGLEASQRFLQNNKPDADSYTVMISWHNIFTQLLSIPVGTYSMPSRTSKPLVAFVADGGWEPWKGSDILTKGVGGSETWIIEMARWIQANGQFDCIVFCNCSQPERFEGVRYMHLSMYPEFIMRNQIHSAIISRYTQYIPLSIYGFVENVYLVLHDLAQPGAIIPVHPKLKRVVCLTEWHKAQFLSVFPQFSDRTDSLYYGVDVERFRPRQKVANSFIYSSFPNRGLLPLLQMWPRIRERIPDARLDIYSDIEGKWVNSVAGEQMNEIRRLLLRLEGSVNGVNVHGWVSKDELAAAWSRAEVWFYPCIFEETFCLTALEAAASKVLAIAPPLAALGETIGVRGVLIPGNPMDLSWQDRALKELFLVVNDRARKDALIESNYAWACDSSWKKRGNEFQLQYLGSALTGSTASTASTASNLDYANMLNWTHDLPINGGHRQLFLDALALVNPKRVLEVGTFVGTSLIKILELYPEAIGVAVDAWKSYEEEGADMLRTIEKNEIEAIFYKNIQSAGMNKRITPIKGDSAVVLAKLIAQREIFDFVYVDGSHKCLDCYADLVLAWNLVCVGGVLAIDDVLYHHDKVNAKNSTDVLSYPLRAKEHFFTKFSGQFEVISDSYRTFIRKV